MHRVVVGIEGAGNAAVALRDWELLVRLNSMEPGESVIFSPTPPELSALDVLCEKLSADVVISDLPFSRPKLRRIVAFFPDEALS